MIHDYDQEIERQHEPATVLPDPPEPEYNPAEHDVCDCTLDGVPDHHSADHWTWQKSKSDKCVINRDGLHHFKFRGNDLPAMCECGFTLKD